MMLDLYQESIKISKRSIKFLKFQICFNSLMLLYYSTMAISYIFQNKIIIGILWLLLNTFWLSFVIKYIRDLKKEKIQQKYNLKIYYDELKIVDYPKYIKEQRTKKLKMLKKRDSFLF